MIGLIYVLAILVTAAIAFFGGCRLTKQRAYKHGWHDGINHSVGWIAIALAKMGIQGKELENILTVIAQYLTEAKNGPVEDAGAKEKGGVTEQ